MGAGIFNDPNRITLTYWPNYPIDQGDVFVAVMIDPALNC